MAKFFPKIFKITTIIPEKQILLKVLAKDRFGSAFKNDKKKIIFRLTSLLEIHNQSKTKKTGRRGLRKGRLAALSAITFVGGVTLCYAKYDPDFRSDLTEYVPFIDPVIKTICLEKDKSDTSKIIQANDHNKGSKGYIPSLGTIKDGTERIISTTYNGIKKPINSLFSRSEPNEGKNFSKGLKNYIPSIGTVKDGTGTGHILSTSYNGIKKPISSLFFDSNKGLKDYIPSFGTIKEGTGYILFTTYNGIKRPISSLFSGSEPNEGKDSSKGLKDYVPSFGTIKEGTGYILFTTYNGIKRPISSLFFRSEPNQAKDSSKGLKDYIPSFGTIKEGTVYILFTTYNGIKRPISSLFSGSEPNEGKDSSKGLKDYIPSFGTIKEGTVYILFTTYNGIKRPISCLFSGSEPNEGKDSSKSMKDYIPSFGTIKEGTVYILFTTYNGIKRPISCLFSGSEPNEGKDSSKSMKDYIPSFGTIKESTGYILFTAYNIMKKTITILFSGSEPNEGKGEPDSSKGLKDYIPSFSTIQEGTGYILFTAYNIMKKPITILFSGSEPNAGQGSTCSLMTVLNGLSEQLKIIGNILKNSFENISEDDKWKLLFMWLQNIDNIYYAMETFNTPTSSIILSQYPKYSKDLSKLISSSISKEEDYSKVVTVLACATVISIQLLLIAYFNVPFTGQLENIAFSVFNATLLKDNPKFQEILEVTMKTIQNYVPDKIQSTDWLYYVNVMNMAYSFFTLAASYVK